MYKQLANQTFLIAALTAVVAVHTLFVLTYPMNVSGDGSAYLQMMNTRQSSLIHASGYPFLVGLPFIIFGGKTVAEPVTLYPGRVVEQALWDSSCVRERPNERAIVWFQHSILLFGTVATAIVLYRGFSPASAVVFLIVCGMDPFLVDDASTARPEWMQAVLLQLTCLALFVAHRTSLWSSRVLAFAVATVLFAFCVLTKPIIVLMGGLLFVVPWLGKASRPAKLAMSALMVMSFSATLWCFIAYFHQPSTGTWKYSSAPGWEMSKAALRISGDSTLSADTGRSASRLIALYQEIVRLYGAKLPPSYFHWNINAVPDEVRMPIRAAKEEIWKLSDKDLRARVTAGTIPPSPYPAIVYLYYYLGLEDADALGRAMYWEAASKEPLCYLGKVLAGGLRGLVMEKAWSQAPLLTSWRNLKAAPPGYLEEGQAKSLYRTHGEGFVTFDLARNTGLGYTNPIFWLPGMKVLTQLANLRIPLPAVTGAALLAILLCVFQRDNKQKRYMLLLLAVNILVFAFGASAIAELRWHKELRAIYPMLVAIASVGVCMGFARLRQAFGVFL